MYPQFPFSLDSDTLSWQNITASIQLCPCHVYTLTGKRGWRNTYHSAWSHLTSWPMNLCWKLNAAWKSNYTSLIHSLSPVYCQPAPIFLRPVTGTPPSLISADGPASSLTEKIRTWEENFGQNHPVPLPIRAPLSRPSPPFVYWISLTSQQAPLSTGFLLKASFLMYTNLSLGYLPHQLWFRLFNSLCNKTPWEKHTYWRPTNPFLPVSLYPHQTPSLPHQTNCSGQGHQWHLTVNPASVLSSYLRYPQHLPQLISPSPLPCLRSVSLGTGALTLGHFSWHPSDFPRSHAWNSAGVSSTPRSTSFISLVLVNFLLDTATHCVRNIRD